MDLHKIKIHFTTPKNPNSNSLIERIHSYVIEHIRILRQTRKKEPITHLINYAVMAYNHSIHSATNYAPLELLLGHTPNRDVYDIADQQKILQEYLISHKNKLNIMYDKVKENMEKNKLRVVTNRNLRDDSELFKDQTQVYTKVDKRNKNNPKFEGPFDLVKITDKNVALIRKNKKVTKRHLRNLKRPNVSGRCSLSTPKDS